MYLLFDIGGTNTRIGISKTGQEIDRVLKIDTPLNYQKALNEFEVAASELIKEEGLEIEAIIAGVPAPIDKTGTKLVNPAHLPDWADKIFTKDLGERLKAPVSIVNDTALIGLGEATRGSGKDYDNVAFIGIGTGIGGALIINKEIAPNSSGFEPGHHIVSFGSQPDHWEGLVSGTAIRERFGKSAQDIIDPKVWKELNNQIAIGLYNVSLFWSPDVIVIGGGLGTADVINTTQIYAELQEINDIRQRMEEVPILVKASLGDKGGLIGGLHYLIESL